MGGLDGMHLTERIEASSREWCAPMTVDLLQGPDQVCDTQNRPSDRLTSADLARALHAERLRISRDLHDQTAQQIAILNFNLQGLRGAVSCAEDASKLERALREVETLSKDLHAAVHGLRMTALERFGLVAALDALVADWGDRFGIATQFLAEIGEEPRSCAVESALFCVVQEALTNVAKHALTAKAVSVTLHCTKQEIALTVADDGNGFDPAGASGEPVANGQAYGLLGLRERLADIGGLLNVTSGTSGTSVTARVSSRSQ